MPDPDIEESEEFTTYYCPHCENLFVMVGLGQTERKNYLFGIIGSVTLKKENPVDVI